MLGRNLKTKPMTKTTDVTIQTMVLWALKEYLLFSDSQGQLHFPSSHCHLLGYEIPLFLAKKKIDQESLLLIHVSLEM